MSTDPKPGIEGPRTVITPDSPLYPEAFTRLANPPKALHVIGDPAALAEGVAIVGARRAPPYGLECARMLAALTAERGIVQISGGALGIEAEAMKAALSNGGRVVAFLGCGLDKPYPASHAPLFQKIVDGGGAVVSAQPWDFPPLPYAFRERNRLIASFAKATLIVEAGLPSGTFSVADAALAAGREVFAVPGRIFDAQALGANHLIAQGATPIVGESSYQDALERLFGLPSRNLGSH